MTTSGARPHPPKEEKPFPLMLLPTEIRVMILRELLESHDTIKPSGGSDMDRESDTDGENDMDEESDLWDRPKYWNGQYGRKLARSAQILRTCKTIYAEGLDLLYSTTLALDFVRDEDLGFFLGVFLWRAPGFPDSITPGIPGLETEIRDLDPNLFGCINRMPSRSRSHEAILRLAPTRRRFQKFEIEVALYYLTLAEAQEALFVLFRLLRYLLLDKHVVVKVTYYEYIGRAKPDSFFSGHKILKCRSLRLEGPHNSDFALDVGPNHVKPYDTLQVWWHFNRYFLFQLPRIQGKSFREDCKSEIDKLQQHTVEYNLPSFRKVHRNTLARAVEWNDTWSDVVSASRPRSAAKIFRNMFALNRSIKESLKNRDLSVPAWRIGGRVDYNRWDFDMDDSEEEDEDNFGLSDDDEDVKSDNDEKAEDTDSEEDSAEEEDGEEEEGSTSGYEATDEGCGESDSDQEESLGSSGEVIAENRVVKGVVAEEENADVRHAYTECSGSPLSLPVSKHWRTPDIDDDNRSSCFDAGMMCLDWGHRTHC